MYRILVSIRSVVIAILLLLLIGFSLLREEKTYKKPIVSILIDNSESMSSYLEAKDVKSIANSLYSIESALLEKGYKVEINTFNKASTIPNKISDYNVKISNINEQLRHIEDKYSNKYLVSTIFLSDGIYNQGIDPLYTTYNYPINTIAVGDSSQRRDVSIVGIFNNKIARLGNTFEIKVDIAYYNIESELIKINLEHDNKLIDSKVISIDKTTGFSSVELVTVARKKGINNYTVSIDPIIREDNLLNNKKSTYIDVLEDKESVLLIGSIPHPAIKTLKYSIQNETNYSIDVFIASYQQTRILDAIKTKKYDAVILHGISESIISIIKEIKNKNLPIWYFLTDYSDMYNYNQHGNLLALSYDNMVWYKASAHFNENFSTFSISNSSRRNAI